MEFEVPVTADVDPKLLRPNPWNTNLVSPENEAKLVESLKRLGIFKPIVVRDHPDSAAVDALYEILGGEHRWQGAMLIGAPTVPIFNLGVIDDRKAKEISIADNSRYGADDTIEFARMLEEMGAGAELQEFLPYTGADIEAIFASTDIALDDLELPDDFDKESGGPEEPAPSREPKTHTIMRFKVPILDSERITALLKKIQKRQGFNASDQLTNAGDALVHQLFFAGEEK